jgi:Leucine-rich repeat (LRR) protein
MQDTWKSLSLCKNVAIMRNLVFFLLLSFLLGTAQAQIDGVYDPGEPGPIPKERLVTERWYYGLKEALAADPADVYKMSLRGNKLKKLPPEIGQLYNLQILILSNNKLKSLPSEIGKLKNLQELNLYKNKIITLPESIGSLRNMEIFLASKNRIIYLPSAMRTLENLKRMDISFNHLNPREVEELLEALPDCMVTY